MMSGGKADQPARRDFGTRCPNGYSSFLEIPLLHVLGVISVTFSAVDFFRSFIMKKSDVANLSGGINTEDGRTVYGLDAEVYAKVCHDYLIQ